jgi:hypothetical protein
MVQHMHMQPVGDDNNNSCHGSNNRTDSASSLTVC